MQFGLVFDNVLWSQPGLSLHWAIVKPGPKKITTNKILTENNETGLKQLPKRELYQCLHQVSFK